MSDEGNLLTLETTKGDVVIRMRPTWPPATSTTSRSWSAKNSMTASCSTA